MAETPTKKYELIKVGRLKIHRSDKSRKFYQLRALIDIPEHGVKTGDLGGYVTYKDTLSHEGSCWVGGQAQLIGYHISVKDHAYVGGNAVIQSFTSKTLLYAPIVISGSARVFDNATVTSRNTWTFSAGTCTISQDSQVYGNAVVETAIDIKGASKIYGSVKVSQILYIYNCEIYDNAIIATGSKLKNCSLYGNAIVQPYAEATSSVIYGNAVVEKDAIVTPGTIINGITVLKEGNKDSVTNFYGEIPSVESLAPASISAIQSQSSTSELPVNKASIVPTAIMKTYQKVCEDIQSYQTDIVKIIKHPVMTDITNEHTLGMMSALKAVQRLEDDPADAEFKDAVIALENAFMKAESNSRRLASSLLSETEKKKTEKAKDLFRVASNEASSEQEKKVAFIQGFKQLEGVLDVPESAVDAFRIKIGLPELEM